MPDRDGRCNKPVRVLRAGPSALLARSARHRARSVREHQVEKESYQLLKAAFINRCIFSWSFKPGDLSKREQASTPHGPASSMALRTFSASRPPAITTFLGIALASDQSNVFPVPPYTVQEGVSSSKASTADSTSSQSFTLQARQIRMPNASAVP